MKITAEQIERAKCVNLPDFLMSQGFNMKKSGSEYVWQDHDSLYIHNNSYGEHGKWYRFSTKNGGDNIDFVREFMNKDFIEAVELLNGERYDRDISYNAPVESKPKKTDKADIFIEENPDSKRLFAYLCQTRGLDFKLVSSLVREGKIAQESKTGNIIFKITDENNKLVGAEKVGTSTQHKFKGVAAGTANGYGFEVCCGKGENLMFFESAVDMLSYMQMNNPDNCRLVSMMGIKPSIVIDTMKRCGISPENVFLCSDNDIAGNDFADRLIEEYPAMKRIVPEDRYKDWNDMLRDIPIDDKTEEKKEMVTYGNKIWNDATDNKDKTLISISDDNFKNLYDRLENSGINYLAYSKDGTTVMAVNDKDISWLKQIIGNENLNTRKSNISHTPPDKNIIGNTEYRYIPQKEYVSADKDTALKMAELMQKQDIKFSGRIYPNGKAILTVSHADLERANTILQTVTDMRKQFAKQDKIQENTREIIGNTSYRDIRQRQYIFSKMSPEQYKAIKPFLDENAQYSGVIHNGKITFTVEIDNADEFIRLLESTKNANENIIENEKSEPELTDNATSDPLGLKSEDSLTSELPELTNKEKAFLSADIVPFMAKAVLSWDEIESIGYRFYEDGYEDLGDAFFKLFKDEYDDIVHGRTVEDLRDIFPDITDETADKLINAFDGAIMHDWQDNEVIQRKIKKALYEILGDEEKTEKAFASIADMKYNFKAEPKTEESPIHFGLFGNGVTAYDISRTDKETDDYVIVAHISPEGVVKVYDNSISAEDMARIENEALSVREDFIENFNSLDTTSQLKNSMTGQIRKLCSIWEMKIFPQKKKSKSICRSFSLVRVNVQNLKLRRKFLPLKAK